MCIMHSLDLDRLKHFDWYIVQSVLERHLADFDTFAAAVVKFSEVNQ